MSRTITITTTISDLEVEVEATPTPGEAATRTNPGVGPEVEFEGVWIKSKVGDGYIRNNILGYLDEATIEAITEEVLQKAGEDDERDYEDEMERRMDEQREDR